MSSTPNLRFKLDPTLSEELREQLTQIWTDVSNADGAVGFVPPTTVEAVRPVAEEAFQRSATQKDHIIVAFVEEQPIGFVFLTGRPGALFGHWATVKRLQVHPDSQGSGIGGALIEAVHEMARDQLGMEQLLLTVRGGTGRERFYERHGYNEVARIPGLIRVAPGDDRDEIYMTREL